MSTERPGKRARSAVACRRCKHRKQRCDNQFPTCSNCLSAGETCSYESKLHPPDYVESLEHRVAELERQLQAKEKQIEPSQTTPTSDLQSSAASGHDAAAGNGFEMLSSPSFFGTSSGYHLAKAVHAAIQSPSSEDRGRPGSTTPFKKEASLPDAALGRQLIQVYLNKVHSKHPFLSPRRILHLHQTRDAVRTSSSTQGSQTARLDSFILCMIYTIGARYHQLSQNEYPCSPDAYYAAAMEDVEVLFQSPGLESLEGMLLLVIFQLRSSKPTEIWSLLGITMRQAVNLGLHRRFNGSLVADQRRRLIFWTIYMLERSIARTMGRPMSISDRDIDVDLPMNVDADIDNEGDIISALAQNQQPSTMSAVIHIFRLTRIESKIYSAVHRVDRPITEIPTGKIDNLRQLLEQWREDIALHVSDSDQQDRPLLHYYATSTYHILHYHLALLLLLLPRLTTLPSTSPDFKTCISSAGQVCQLYKQLHDRQSVLAYSIIALHATFVAGLTLVYCFIADPSILNVQFNSDIRACSTVLYVISERWPMARKVRDAFEKMLARTVESADLGLPSTTVGVSDAQFDSLWAGIATQFSCEDVLDRDDIWNALGPWFDLDDQSTLGSGQMPLG